MRNSDYAKFKCGRIFPGNRTANPNFRQIGLPQKATVRLNSGVYQCRVLGYFYEGTVGRLLIRISLINHPFLGTIYVNRERLPRSFTTEREK